MEASEIEWSMSISPTSRPANKASSSDPKVNESISSNPPDIGSTSALPLEADVTALGRSSLNSALTIVGVVFGVVVEGFKGVVELEGREWGGIEDAGLAEPCA